MEKEYFDENGHIILPSIVGTIDLGDEIGECDIIVNPEDEENKTFPHFHIKSKSNDFETCIGIYEAKYYNHDKIVGVLSDKQIDILNKVLIDKSLDEVPYNIGCRILWDAKNGEYEAEEYNQPDYRKMK